MLARVVSVFVVACAHEIVDSGQVEELLRHFEILERDEVDEVAAVKHEVAVIAGVEQRVEKIGHISADVGVDIFPVTADGDVVFGGIVAAVGEEQMGVGDMETAQGFLHADMKWNDRIFHRFNLPEVKWFFCHILP